jgi:parallel beta-helix repeat protein
MISNNNFTDNNYGFSLSSSSSNAITENNFVNNSNGLYFSGSSSNNIYRNNFLNNTRHVGDAGMDSPLASVKLTTAKTGSAANSKPAAMRVETVNFVGPPPLSANNWNSGNVGNFWSDYKGTDADGDGIGDTPYFLYGNNADNYPLMKPAAITVPEFPVWVILPIFAVAMLCALTLRRKVHK